MKQPAAPESSKPQGWLGILTVAVILGAGFPARRWRYLSTPHVTGGAAAPAPAGLGRLAFRLTEASRETGVAHTHQKLTVHPSLKRVAPFLQGLAGASVAVADVDGDGWPDVYLANSAIGSPNRLFRNNRDGTFTDVADKAGLADVNRQSGSLRPLFFDYDNNGTQDLLLLTAHCPKLFRNGGKGRFADVTAASGFGGQCGYAYAANVLDYDGDGFLDVVIGDYYQSVDLARPRTTKFMFNRLFYADNGGPIRVYRNGGDGIFRPVPDALGLKSRGWSHAIGVYDLRDTGHPDLFFATDFNFDQLYFWRSGRYVDSSSVLGAKYSHFGMNAEIADVDNDGRPLIFVTDIYEPGHTVASNSLWKAGKEGFRNLAKERGVAHCGWAWGAKFLDLDNDRNLDLVVTNGMVSANPKTDYWFRMETVNAGGTKTRAELKDWPAFGDASFSGYQKKCVFYNVGGRFVDASALTGLGDDDSDGRGLAAIDYLNNGSLSLVEASVGQPARFYRNDQDNRNHWIGFKLIGRRSNRDAFGAKVSVELEGETLSREHQPANGLQLQCDARVHFGLGENPRIQRVVIRWPSGIRQTLQGLAIDKYQTVEEPLGPG